MTPKRHPFSDCAIPLQGRYRRQLIQVIIDNAMFQPDEAINSIKMSCAWLAGFYKSAAASVVVRPLKRNSSAD